MERRRDFWDGILFGSNDRRFDREDVEEEFDVESEFDDRRRHNVDSRRDDDNDDRRRHDMDSHRDDDRRHRTTCEKLADIIGGDVIASEPACVVMRLRDIDASILGRRTQSPLALPFALSFEDNEDGNTLNLGETVILQKEINRFLTELRKRGIKVTALHNHWLFDQPRLMYMHWEDVGDPVKFARNSIEAARAAGLF